MAVQLLAILAAGGAVRGGSEFGGVRSSVSRSTGRMVGENLKFNISDDITRLSNRLSNIQRQQLPFATALAMTRTAQGLLREQKKEMRRSFQKPVPYTMKAIAYQPADKKDEVINSRVFFRQFSGKGTPAYKYLEPNIFGGQRGQKRHEKILSNKLGGTIFTAPASDAPVNAAGNITGGNYTRILAAVQAFNEVGYTSNATTGSKKRNKSVRGYYVAHKNGKAVGIRQRTGGSNKKILNFFDTPPTYSKRYDFYGLGERYVAKNLPRNFKSALRQAIRTAR
jgi:hypothetical protein